MKKLFEPVTVGSLTLKNRLIRSAIFDLGMAEDGVISARMADYYRRLAEGGAGLIITGMMGASENSRNYPSMIQIYNDRFERDFSLVVQAVHQAGGLIAAQLGHTGVKCGYLDRGDHPYGPSDYQNAKAMTHDQIAAMVAAYGEAARKCKNAGADAVEIHSAHGYLLSQFLSPYYNHRTDEYGGAIGNRSRVCREIYASIRAAVGPEFPIILKINYCDLIDGGLTGGECIQVCRDLEAMGLDAVEISSGVSVSRESNSIQKGKGEAFNGAYALDVASAVKIPVISVGGYRTLKVMEDFLNRGNIAAISLGRPLIREPDLPRRWAQDENVVPKCISCNYCFKEPLVRCAVEQKLAAGQA